MTTAAASGTGTASDALFNHQMDVLDQIVKNTSGTINSVFADAISAVMPSAAAFRSAYASEQARIASEASPDGQETASTSQPVSITWLQTSGFLQHLLDDIRSEIYDANQQAQEAAKIAAQDAAKAGLVSGAAMTAQASGQPVSAVNFADPNQQLTPGQSIAQLLQASGDATPDSNNADDTTNDVKTGILAGALAGLSGQALMMGVQTVLQGAASSALGMGANAAQGGLNSAMSFLISANSALLDGWVWLCSFDDSCLSCIMMDGTVHDASETLDSHKNCGCQMGPISPAFNLDDLQTGEDWLMNTATDEELVEILGPSKYLAYQNGDVQLMDLVSDAGGFHHEVSLKSLGIDFRDYLQQLPTKSELLHMPDITIVGPHPFSGSVLTDEEKALLDEAEQMIAQAAKMPELPEIKVPPEAEPGNTMGYKIDISKKDAKVLDKMVGQHLTPDDIGGMVGAQKGDFIAVSVRANFEGKPVVQFELSSPTNKLLATRGLFIDDAGNLAMSNSSISVLESMQGQGIGARYFAEEVQKLSDLGVSYIEAPATGNAAALATGEGYNGFYTWARFGYQTNLADLVDEGLDLNALHEAFPGVETLQDLMLEEGGPEYWRANGVSFRGVFDLADGSTSRQILDGYLEEKGIEIAPLKGAEAVEEATTALPDETAVRDAFAQKAIEGIGDNPRITYRATVNGQDYFVKKLPYMSSEARERAGVALLQDLGDEYVLPTAYGELADETPYMIQPWTGGETLESVKSASEVLQALPLEDRARLTAADYLLGQGDKGLSNYLVLPDGSVRLTDFEFLGDASSTELDLTGPLVRDAYGATPLSDIPIPRDVLNTIQSQRDALVADMRSGRLLHDASSGFQQRLDILDQLAGLDNPTLEDLQRLGAGEEVERAVSPEVQALQDQRATLEQLDPNAIHPTTADKFGTHNTYRVEVDGQSYFVKTERAPMDLHGVHYDPEAQTAAADKAAQIMGIDTVVPARFIENDAGRFIVQPWVDGQELTTVTKDALASVSSADLQREGLFEYLIGDADRGPAGYFLTPDGSLRAVDFGGAFDVQASEGFVLNNILSYAAPDTHDFVHIAIDRTVAEDLLSRAAATRVALEDAGLDDAQLALFDDHVATLRSVLDQQDRPALFDLVSKDAQQYYEPFKRNALFTVGHEEVPVAEESPQITALRTQKATLTTQRDAVQSKLDTLSEKWRNAVLDQAKYDPEDDAEEWAAAEKKIQSIEKQQATQIKKLDSLDGKMAKVDAKIEKAMPTAQAPEPPEVPTEPAVPEPPQPTTTYTLSEIDQNAEQQIIQTAQDALSGDGVASHAEVMALGQPIHDYIDQRIGELADWGNEAFDLRVPGAKWTKAQIAWYNGDADALAAHGGLTIQEAQIQYTQVMGQETLRLLQQARDVGGVDLDIAEGADETITDALREVQQILPSDWLAASNDQGELMLKESESRGSYRPARTSGDGTITMRPSDSMSPDDYTAIIAHEFGHRAEDSVNGLWLLEKELYESRTGGEDFVDMPEKFAVQAQKTKVDKWAMEYVGREPILYTRAPGLDAGGSPLRTIYSYELLSSGLEWVAGNNTIYAYYLSRDEEFHMWLLGILFGAKDHTV